MSEPAGPRRFATTRWSLVLAAGGTQSPARDQALATLCETYWKPVYAFIRRSGRAPEEAADLTQAFFVRVLEKEYFSDARPDRGRFRSFLLTSVRHFLANEYDFRHAQKRGGHAAHLPLYFEEGEREYNLEPPDNLTPERVYERRWAMAILGAAMQRLADKYAESGRRQLFDRLRPFLVGDEPAYADLARELDMTAGALRVAVHRLRQQFGAALREIIAETVDGPEEVDAELAHLLHAVEKT